MEQHAERNPGGRLSVQTEVDELEVDAALLVDGVAPGEGAVAVAVVYVR